MTVGSWSESKTALFYQLVKKAESDEWFSSFLIGLIDDGITDEKSNQIFDEWLDEDNAGVEKLEIRLTDQISTDSFKEKPEGFFAQIRYKTKLIRATFPFVKNLIWLNIEHDLNIPVPKTVQDLNEVLDVLMKAAAHHYKFGEEENDQ